MVQRTGCKQSSVWFSARNDSLLPFHCSIIEIEDEKVQRFVFKVVSKGVLFGICVACHANVYSKSGNKIM